MSKKALPESQPTKAMRILMSHEKLRSEWDELRQRGQNPFVPGVGDPTASIMIVGEAPGEEEARKQQPFVGVSGKLLRRALHLSQGGPAGRGGRAPIDPEDCWITNVLHYRPPGNRNPKPKETAQAVSFMQAEMNIVRPDIVVLCGKFAQKTVREDVLDAMKTKPKTDKVLHGTIGSRRFKGHPVQVVGMYHPSYALRTNTQGEWAKTFAESIDYAIEHIGE